MSSVPSPVALSSIGGSAVEFSLAMWALQIAAHGTEAYLLKGSKGESLLASQKLQSYVT